MTTEQPPTPPGAPDAPPNAWLTLLRAMRPRGTRAQVLTGLLCAALGFAIAVQVRQTQEPSLSTMRQSDLVSLLDQTTQQADDLQRQAAELERTRQELQSGSNSRQAALEAATKSAAALGILTGRLPAEGPGLVLTLTGTDDATTALKLLNVLEELRNAGAEAIELNGLRLTASTYFARADAGVEVDGTVLQSPYRWLVIGDPETMSPALSIPGGALPQWRSEGRANVSSEDLVQITAVRSVPEPRFATPVPPAAG